MVFWPTCSASHSSGGAAARKGARRVSRSFTPPTSSAANGCPIEKQRNVRNPAGAAEPAAAEPAELEPAAGEEPFAGGGVAPLAGALVAFLAVIAFADGSGSGAAALGRADAVAADDRPWLERGGRLRVLGSEESFAVALSTASAARASAPT